MDWWMVMRIACLVGCTVCGLLLSTAKFHQWDEWSPKTQDHWWALAGWTFVGFYGTIENMIQHNRGGSRLIVLTLVIALTLRALLRSGELRAQSVIESRKKDPT